jgi:quercetin dioxygenase-like cupin family protein
MKIINLEDVPKVKADLPGAEDTYKQVPISKADGAAVFSFRVFTVEPGGHTPFHEHPFEHLNYVINGQGAIVAEDKSEQKIKKGDFALVGAGEKHQYKNLSADEDLVLICGVEKEYE